MGRSKIKIELIEDDKKRKSTLVNRKAGLVKKISELSILCDVKACMIIYERNYNHQICPNDSNDVRELINLYKKQSLEGRTKGGKTLSNFFENDEKKKAEITVEKYPTWDSRFDYLSQKELQNFAGVVEKRIEKAKGKIELLKSMNDQDPNIGSLTFSSTNMEQQLDEPNYSMAYFLSNIPISDVNSMGAGMDNGLLTINDYQFNNLDHFTMIETGNWLANNGIGSSSTMQPMMNNGTDSSSTMEYPFIYNGYTHMPYGSHKTIVPIVLCRNGSYDDMIASVIKAGELACEPRNLMTSYQINGRGKIHPTFIKNDRHVSLYMMDIAADGSRPILRINIIVRSLIEPTNSFNDNDLVEYENLGDQLNERFCDQSNDNLGDDSINRYDHSVNVEDQPEDAEDFKHFKEV
ncbi:hypothetical protein H5410_055948 [Solanum commersonii]|uniref:MADS-box domain-containing protein n=1 Tax=Solanum commersonii TaxID=4109 RepID=A0A9J5WLR2_SOLCO|nr:hypothetical protein H5410_055948 [Solanum commersonii]